MIAFASFLPNFCPPFCQAPRGPARAWPGQGLQVCVRTQSQPVCKEFSGNFLPVLPFLPFLPFFAILAILAIFASIVAHHSLGIQMVGGYNAQLGC